MVQLIGLTLALLCALVAPATSWAGDPLLSGYGGPGSGQQVLLGSQLLGRPGGGGGGGSAGDAGQAGLRAPATSASASAGATSPSGGGAGGARGSAKAHAKGGASAKGGSSSNASKAAGSGAGGSPAVPGAAPRRIAYPARASDAGGFPLSGGDVVGALLALLAIAGMGVWMRRTVTGSGGPGAQAP